MNKIELYRDGFPLRLRQVGLEALDIAQAEKVKLNIDPKGTNDKQVGFFVRTKSGKPDRKDGRIKSIIERACERYSGHTVVEKGKIVLVKDDSKKTDSKKTESKPSEK